MFLFCSHCPPPHLFFFIRLELCSHNNTNNHTEKENKETDIEKYKSSFTISSGKHGISILRFEWMNSWLLLLWVHCTHVHSHKYEQYPKKNTLSFVHFHSKNSIQILQKQMTALINIFVFLKKFSKSFVPVLFVYEVVHRDRDKKTKKNTYNTRTNYETNHLTN